MPKLQSSLQRSQTLESKRNAAKKGPRTTVKKNKTAYRYKLEVREDQRVLFIGEGNFSFALSLAEKIHRGDNFVCTAFDTEIMTCEKYPEAQGNLDALRDMGARCLFEVDATRLSKNTALKGQFYDKIIFNFPHVGLGIKDQNRNVMANQDLIINFMQQSRKKLNKGGDIVISIKTGIPYDLWQMKKLARDVGLELRRSFEFLPDDYPGYAHRRTIGFDATISAPDNLEITKKPARMFILGEVVTGDESSSEINEED